VLDAERADEQFVELRDRPVARRQEVALRDLGLQGFLTPVRPGKKR
jgi:hypothetical protein